jgi:DNA-binding beta-propeller fold protein YncE
MMRAMFLRVREIGACLGAVLAACALSACGSGGHSSSAAQPQKNATPSSRRHAARPSVVLAAHPAGQLPAPVQGPATTAVGAGAVLAGGLDQADVSVADIVQAGQGPARAIGSLPTALHDAAAATIAGRPYLFGGGEPSHSEIWQLSGSGARQVGQLPAPASDVAAATIGSTAYIVGGYTGVEPLRTIVAWGGKGTGRIVGMLPHPIRYAAVTAIDGHLIIAGGTSGDNATRDVYSFDPADGRVTRIALLPSELTHAVAAVDNGLVYVIGGRGGYEGTQTSRILAIDPNTGHVQPAGHLPIGLSDVGAWSDPGAGGGIVVAGGREASGTLSAAMYTLRPKPSGAVKAAVTSYKVPPELQPGNVYAADRSGDMSPAVQGDRPLVYVPNSGSNTVDEIDPTTYKIVRQFDVGALPQHVVPSYDLRTLWVTNDEGNTLTPINPRNGVPGSPIPVEDPYNMYFTPDGRYAVVMAERLHRIDFRDAHTMRLHHSLDVPQCIGVNHADFTADGRLMFISCEFGSAMIVVDVPDEKVVKTIPLPSGSSPQDVKLSPDGRVFYVADLYHAGLWEFDATTFKRIGFLPTGAGAHGLYPSRDAQYLYVTNRTAGTISVVSFATRKVVRTWTIPGGSPDMGNVSASGNVLWVSGRYDAQVYAIDTISGRVIRRIAVGAGPHGVCVFPQPGRYSLGHTGIMR